MITLRRATQRKSILDTKVGARVGPKTAMAISFMLGIITILLIIAYIFRDDIFQSLQDPKVPFQTVEQPKAPNYDDPTSWIARPDLSADPFEAETKGDAFIVVPAVYRGGEFWNLPIDDDRRRTKLQRIVRPNYVAPYAQAGRLFAPYYRQSALYTFMTNREDAKLAQDLAYQDVRRAFQIFLKNSPPERPIILAGHGQGASHLQRLLGEFMTESLSKRLAAAYIIDHPFPMDFFESDIPHLKPCEVELDTNCVVAFGTFMPGDKVIAERFVSHALVYQAEKYETVNGRELLCTNPLLWSRSTDYAPSRLHRGGIAAEGLDPDTWPAPTMFQTGAQCVDGVLLIDKPKSPSFRRPRFKFGSKYRTLPSNIFYEDLRQNAANRVEALYHSAILPRRAPLIEDLTVIEVKDSPITPIKE